MRGFLRLFSGVVLVAAPVACSNIIGVSELEIDPSLGVAGSGASSGSGGTSSGGTSSGGTSSGGTSSGGTSSGGDSTLPEAGETSGGAAGSSAQGGTSTGGGAGAGTSGDAGAGGEPPSGCRDASDCDDQIACTDDTCLPNGECRNTADDTACTAATGKCTSCRPGIGCVDFEPAQKDLELLLDPKFDELTGDWQEFSDVDAVSSDAAAQSGTHSVFFSAAPANATETRFFDVAQIVHIPAGTIKLTASGWYKMLWAPEEKPERPRSDEYVTLTLFSVDPDDDGEYVRYLDFHTWDGDDPEQTTWKAFTYEASKAALNKVQDLEITLDLVAETWDTKFYFDTMSLKATVCE
jgi:hypothetical protein